MKRKYVILISIACCLLIAVALVCILPNFFPYDKFWIIGKSKSEIVERYGEFDFHHSENVYGYTTKESYIDFIGLRHPDEFFLICFDENDIAYHFEENYPRPGG